VSFPGEVTRLLAEIRGGNSEAESQLIPLVYNELRRLAHHYMKSERSNHTLQATAVVHEVFLRLVKQRNVSWQSKAHFLAVAASLMRRVLCDYARSHGRTKRGAEYDRVSLDEALVFSKEISYEVIDLDRALTLLGELDPRQSKIVEMLFFGGLTVEETAAALGISPKTVKRDWSVARAWLYRELQKGNLNDTGTVGTRQRTI
jgi:RNA polymerase sigma-70 factor (ECF subfamily)